MRPLDSPEAIVAVAALVQGDTASLEARVRLYREWIRDVERRQTPTSPLLGILRETLALLQAEIARRAQLPAPEESPGEEPVKKPRRAARHSQWRRALEDAREAAA